MTSISLATLARRAADLGNPLPCSDDTQLWFSEHPADLELAKAMCETCPLRRPCLAGAIDRAEPFGVWGGLDEEEREQLQSSSALERETRIRPASHDVELARPA